MRKNLVVANWKMNMLRGEAKSLAGRVSKLLETPGRVDVALAPPFTSLDVVRDAIRGTEIELGAQNAFWEPSGAYTGEVSPQMLFDAGCRWVIIGHSERRKYFGETDRSVHKKARASLSAGVAPIVCVGETLEQREQGKTISVIEEQLEKGVRDLALDDPERFVIAYEPVWAIGTGKNAEPEDVGRVHGFVRGFLSGLWGDEAERIRIIYGGSVDPGNIKDLISEPNVDGALVGGASLKPDSFAQIVKLAGD